MSKTVVVISETGRLIDVTGTDKESDAHYLYFAKRLLGDDGTYATLDYGWNGSRKLKISSRNGQEILLDARDVKISGTLIVNNTPLQDFIDSSVDLKLSGIQGTPGEIDVLPEENQSADDDQPRRTYTISISEDLKSRISSLEHQIAGMFAFDGIYYAGDGLVTLNDPVQNTINVFIGTGLKFEQKEYDFEIQGSSSSASPIALMKPAVAVDCASIVTPDGSTALKPITAGAVYEAIASAVATLESEIGAIGETDVQLPRYALDIDPITGNTILYDTLESSSSSNGE